MSYEFKKLSEVESLNEVPKIATVLAEVDGAIKRIPSSGLGGTVKTAIIKHQLYDEAVAYFGSEDSASPASAVASSSGQEYYCTNMTFEEAYETMYAGEPLDVILMCVQDAPFVHHAAAMFGGVQMTGEPTIIIGETTFNIMLTWTADGISAQSDEC